MINTLTIENGVTQTKQVIETDPTSSFPNLAQGHLIEAFGLIPQIMFDPKHQDLSLWDALNAGYAHGGGLTQGSEATLGEDLSYNYPGDEPLKPLAKYTRGSEVAYQYQYGLMMVEKQGKMIATRMD